MRGQHVRHCQACRTLLVTTVCCVGPTCNMHEWLDQHARTALPTSWFVRFLQDLMQVHAEAETLASSVGHGIADLAADLVLEGTALGDNKSKLLQQLKPQIHRCVIAQALATDLLARAPFGTCARGKWVKHRLAREGEQPP